MRRHVTIRSHLYDFLEARPPAKNHVQEMGLHFERLTIGLIIVSILSFVLSTEVKLYSDDGWRGLFDFVEWVAVLVRRVRTAQPHTISHAVRPSYQPVPSSPLFPLSLIRFACFFL